MNHFLKYLIKPGKSKCMCPVHETFIARNQIQSLPCLLPSISFLTFLKLSPLLLRVSETLFQKTWGKSAERNGKHSKQMSKSKINYLYLIPDMSMTQFAFICLISYIINILTVFHFFPHFFPMFSKTEFQKPSEAMEKALRSLGN